MISLLPNTILRTGVKWRGFRPNANSVSLNPKAIHYPDLSQHLREYSLTEQGKSKKLKGTHKEKEKWFESNQIYLWNEIKTFISRRVAPAVGCPYPYGEACYANSVSCLEKGCREKFSRGETLLATSLEQGAALLM